jgi:hypothetical protein
MSVRIRKACIEEQLLAELYFAGIDILGSSIGWMSSCCADANGAGKPTDQQQDYPSVHARLC